ncbi:TetR/AcrR family transcriptional regulator [Glycomyces sp. NRRL B-16210]|uniref:TetR/AcrR family transcriptional regulator n=1 Tax=Glycomyces sp. NRRL B-16210 TaxID=1463821 RepID=UPI0004BEDE2E|nr:TetR/AcrR family transcriptional regulator [Glycomyces sp. NRRL B-16210]
MNAPKRRDRAATRTALLDAARSRFAEHGFDGTSVRDIAADAGVDATLIFRYFGSKKDLFAEAIRAEVPEDIGTDPDAGPAVLADALVREVVLDDGTGPGEHPLLVMLRSAGRPEVRKRLREEVCDRYLADLATRFEGEDADLRSEMVGALLIGMGVMRSVVVSPVLSEADPDRVRALASAMVEALE